MEYNSISNPLNFDFSLAMGPMNITSKGLEAISSFIGKESTDYVQLLPKFALQYEWEKETVFMQLYPRDIVREATIFRCFLI